MRFLAPLFAATVLISGCVAPGTTTTTTPPGGGTGTTTGGTTPPALATDTQAPFSMPTLSNPGDPVELGDKTLPDVFYIKLSDNPNEDGKYPPSTFNVVANLGKPNQKLVAIALTLSTNLPFAQRGQSSAQQAFTFHGNYGPNATFDLTGAGTGIAGLFVNGVTYDGVPYYSFTAGADSRSSSVHFDMPAGWFNPGHSQDLRFGPYQTPPTVGTTGGPTVGGVPTPVQPSNVMGATINGVVTPTDTLENICKKAVANDNIVLPAAIIAGRCPLSGANLSGQGSAQTIIDGKGIEPSQDKALILTLAPGSTISKLGVRNAAIDAALGGNAAGIRDVAPGVGFNIAGDVELYGNQNGILTFASNFNIDGENSHDNGAGCDNGCTHDNYFGGGPSTVVNVTNSTISKAISAHGLKSRAGTTNVSNSTLIAGGNGAALDVPDGGIVNVKASTLSQPGIGPTHNLMTFATESAANAATGMTATFDTVSIMDPTGVGILQCGNNGALVLVGNDNTYQGPNAGPDIRGCIVTGTFRKVP